MATEAQVERTLAYVRECVSIADNTLAQIYYLYADGFTRKEADADADSRVAKSGYPSLLGDQVADAATALAVALDVAGLSDTRRAFALRWEHYRPSDYGDTDWYGDPISNELEGRICPALLVIKEFVKPLVASFSDDATARVEARLEILRNALYGIPKFLSRLGLPTGEPDIQRAMDAILSSVFPDYQSKKVLILKAVKSFIPDGAVPSLAALIELKFADSQGKAKVGVDGIRTDQIGYDGTSEFTRFYAVLFQTANFLTPQEFEAALAPTGNAPRWTTILLTGDPPLPSANP